MEKVISNWDRTNLPCPCGTSSDSYAVDKNGDGYCFRGGCGKFFKNNKETPQEGDRKITEEINQPVQEPGTYKFYPHRGISSKTMEFYGVHTKFVPDDQGNEVPVECGFVFPNKAVQIKLLDSSVKNRYRAQGPYGEAGLFGTDKFDPGSRESVTICEGLHDALAVYEMTGGQSACVSVKSSGSAKRECIQDWEYINSFKKIILCLDNDEPGRQATKDIAPLFDFNKVYQVRLNKRKDANDYLIHQESKDFLNTWKNARRFAPDNIISTFKEIEEALKVDNESQLGTYPYKVLNERLYGLHEGEVIVVKAPEGVGKTSFFKAIEYHILKTTDHPIGIIHLEEDNGTTIKALAGHELQLPAVLPDCGLSEQDILDGFKRAVRDDEGRVHIYSSFDVEDEDSFLNNIRFLVSAAGCRFIFLDHISWLATGNEDEDERKKLDRISQKLKLLAKELRFCLVEISHVNDNGQTRGSRNITKVANTVISLHRDLVSMDPITRNTTEFLIEKARLGGRTGPGGKGMYNQMSGVLEDFQGM